MCAMSSELLIYFGILCVGSYCVGGRQSINRLLTLFMRAERHALGRKLVSFYQLATTSSLSHIPLPWQKFPCDAFYRITISTFAVSISRISCGHSNLLIVLLWLIANNFYWFPSKRQRPKAINERDTQIEREREAALLFGHNFLTVDVILISFLSDYVGCYKLYKFRINANSIKPVLCMYIYVSVC